jgi:hypothetical protein
MRLLDVNMPKQDTRFSASWAADDRCWGGLTNSALVEAANQAGFRVQQLSGHGVDWAAVPRVSELVEKLGAAS